MTENRTKEAPLSLLTSPVLTLSLFLRYMMKESLATARNVVTHRLTWYVIMPVVLAICAISYLLPSHAETVFYELDINGDDKLDKGDQYDGEPMSRAEFIERWPQEAPLVAKIRAGSAWREVEYIAADVLWWFGLGVLSSVGLGSGMHTGLLFLFPFIFRSCQTGDVCEKHWTYPSNPFFGPRDRMYLCVSGHGTPASLLVRLLHVVGWCVVWGAGTAFGEVPPYLLSYAAAKEGRRMADEENADTEPPPSWNVVERMKRWTVSAVERYGFVGVVLLAAWPNAAFDMCGIACGQFQMPMATFLGATLIGKGLIKVSMQAVFFVALFSGDRVGWALEGLKNAAPWAAVGGAVDGVAGALARLRADVAARADPRHTADAAGGAGGGVAAAAMSWVVALAVGWFAKSIVETFAEKERRRGTPRAVDSDDDDEAEGEEVRATSQGSLVVWGLGAAGCVWAGAWPIAALVAAQTVVAYVAVDGPLAKGRGPNAVGAVRAASLLPIVAWCAFSRR